MNQETEQRIWDYIDGLSSPQERAEVLRMMNADPQWQSKYAELLSIHTMLQDEELEVPSLRFTKNVMDEISKGQATRAAQNYINKRVIRGIAAVFLFLIAGLFSYLIGHLHGTGIPAEPLTPNITMNLSKLNWGRILNNRYVNIFIGINVILALILCDKYIQGKRAAADHLRS